MKYFQTSDSNSSCQLYSNIYGKLHSRLMSLPECVYLHVKDLGNLLIGPLYYQLDYNISTCLELH